MANLLEMLVRGQAGPGTPPLAAGLLGPPEPSRPPSLLDGGGGAAPQRPPSPPGPSPAAAPGVGAAAGVGPGGPGGGQEQPAQQAGPQGPEGPPAGPTEGLRQFRGQVADMVRRAAGGEIPSGAESWIREVTKDAGSRTAGESGRVGFVGRMLGLDRVPGLSEAQTGRLKQQGLITAGLAMMGAPQRASTAQAIASGVLAARADVASSAGELLDAQRAQQQIQERAKILQNPELNEIEKWKALRESALAAGDTEAAEAATDVIGQLEEMDATELESELMDVTGDGRKEEVIRNEDGSVTVRDPFTKEVIDERPAQPVDNKERLDRINQLADDFSSEASDAQDVANAVAIGLDAPPNAAGDVTLLTMLTRAIDPGVSVREADIRRGETIGGMSARAKQMVNQVASGGEMSEEQREFIRNEIRRVGKTQHEQFLPTLQRFSERARDAGVDPRLVVFDPFAPIFGGSGAGGAGGGAGGVDNPFGGPPPGQEGN